MSVAQVSVNPTDPLFAIDLLLVKQKTGALMTEALFLLI
jgi:hypothetical protein